MRTDLHILSEASRVASIKEKYPHLTWQKAFERRMYDLSKIDKKNGRLGEYSKDLVDAYRAAIISTAVLAVGLAVGVDLTTKHLRNSHK